MSPSSPAGAHQDLFAVPQYRECQARTVLGDHPTATAISWLESPKLARSHTHCTRRKSAFVLVRPSSAPTRSIASPDNAVGFRMLSPFLQTPGKTYHKDTYERNYVSIHISSIQCGV